MRLKEGVPAPSLASARAAGSFGKYELCAKLGSGGQAEVYLAVMRGQAGFNKLVVIKKLRAVASDDPLSISRFLDEARLAARLNHPNIVHTYEVGEDNGEYFIAMEYLEGQPMNRLARRPNTRQYFTPTMWGRVAAEALRGLGYAHNLTDYDGTPLCIVHRDISPDNLFLTYDGEVKIVDFGIAKALLNSEKTETGTLKGKVSYMAPEQVRGTVDRRADLFAMGVVLWEFFTGRKLFEGERGSVLYRLMTDPIPSIVTEMPEIDHRLAAIVDRALQKDPDDRFQTAEEMREALEEYISSSGELVPDVQLAKVVRETFAETRQRVQRQVQAAIARVTSRGSNDDLMGALAPRPSLPEFLAAGTPTQEPSPWDVSRPTRSLPRITFQGDTTTSTGASANPELAEIVITSAPAKPPLRPALAIAIGVAVVAVAIAVFFALRTQQPPVATNPPVQPPAQAAPIAAPAVDVNRAPASPVPAAIPPKANIKVEKAEPQDTETPSTQKPESEVANRNDTRQPATPAPPQRTTRQQPQRQVQHQRVAPAPAIKIKETPPPPPVTGPRVKVIEDDPKRKNIDVIND